MPEEKFSFRNEILKLKSEVRSVDRKVIIIFVSVAVLQTTSWYYTSRAFFEVHFLNDLQFNPHVYLIEYLYWFIGDFFTFFILSVLIIKFLLKENLKDYGLKAGDSHAGLIISLCFLVFMVIIIWFVSSSKPFSATYPLLASAKYSWNVFFIFETGILIYLFAWEFIWRGFMLFGLEKNFGYSAVLIQMIPFVILHNGKPAAETFAAILGGIALGILALRTRSIFYGFITHIGVMFSIDFISVLRFRVDDYGTGISSLVNIFKHLI
jgi:CAAX protease family protein